MTVTAGLVVNGDNDDNQLYLNVVHEDNGDVSLYNVIKAGDGNDFVYGWANVAEPLFFTYGTVLDGESGDDTIIGSMYQDSVFGGDGDDYISDFSSGDSADGGDGRDTLLLSGRLLGNTSITSIEVLRISRLYMTDVAVQAIADARTIIGGGAFKFSKAADFVDAPLANGYGWVFSGSSFDDHIDVSGTRGSFSFRGDDGDDILIGGTKNRITGGGGDDTISGGIGRDYLNGGVGNDVISGGGGDDFIMDFDGKNTIWGGEGSDIIDTRTSSNDIRGGDGADHITVNVGLQTVSGGNGHDSITIGQKVRSTQVDCGTGNDLLNDEVRHGHADLTFEGGSGRDTFAGPADLSNISLHGFEVIRFHGLHLTASAQLLDSITTLTRIEGKYLQITLSEGGHFAWDAEAKDPYSLLLHGSEDADILDMSECRALTTIQGRGGDDVITAGGYGTLLLGGDGDDTLIGNGKSSPMKGGTGDDVLIATADQTNVWGNIGSDRFVFTNATGTAEVFDFSREEHDRIDLRTVADVTSFDDLMSHHVRSVSGGVVIVYGTSSILIDHVSREHLDAQDFMI